MPYVPLHVHSVYSGPEGIIGIRDLVSRASFFGFQAVALTDHRSTYGHFEFFEAARGAGIKPIFGAEIQHMPLAGSNGLFHLTVLAENEEGYRNLCALVSRHTTRGKETPVPPAELESRRAGLIALTGCLKGETSQAILHGNLGRARDVVLRLVQIFGASNVFLEIMNHLRPEEELVDEQLRVLSTKTNVPLVITNNDRYLHKDDAESYRLARRIGRKKSDGEAEEPFQEYYLKRERDLAPLFGDARAALDRSGEIADRCTVDLARAGRISFAGAPNAQDALVDMCRRRFVLAFHNRPADERTRLFRAMERELAVAREEGLGDFLIFLRELFMNAFARGIWIELMGSDLLESVVAFLLEISPLNPIDHDLVFESFSASKGGSIPPVELIVSEQQKDRLAVVMAGLIPGFAPCFQIAQEEMSVVTIAKEIAEALGAAPELREELSRILSFEKRHRSLASLLESSEAAQRLYNAEPLVKSVLHAAYPLQGKILHFTLDTSRFVVLPREIDGLYSVTANAAGERFAQLGSAAIEAAGGWILGVQHSHFLAAVEKTIESIRGDGEACALPGLFAGSGRKRWTPESLDDPRAFALIASGETTGVYLLESPGIRDHLMRIKPDTFGELVNVISLYRPGPMEGRLWERYLENAGKKGKVYLPHHSLAPILAATRGVLLYREQIREVLEEAAGLRGKDAVMVEGALWRKDSGELVSARLSFVRGAMETGLNEEDGQRIFDFLLHNVAFTHSKSLSCAQASMSYRTAYLKGHCFERYFTALLNANLGVKDREAKYLEYLKGKGVPVLPYGINADAVAFFFEDGVIRAPLIAVISLDKTEWDAIVEERIYRGDFASFEEFLVRMKDRLSMDAAMALVGAGVFDDGGISRESLRYACDSFYHGTAAAAPPRALPQRSSRSGKTNASANQIPLFGPERGGDSSGPSDGRGGGKGNRS
jgi:DNA polymerase III subunit alpha